MKRTAHTGSGSLDMLLDTMCNTFGGVCFIALMVAIISASLPAPRDVETGTPAVTEQMLVDKELSRLVRERDELKSAIEVQRSFLVTNVAVESHVPDVARMSGVISSNAVALAKLKGERLELEDRLAKLTTETAYSRREAQRLERVLKELGEKLNSPISTKSRAVRTPVERELVGFRPLDVWIRDGKLYNLEDKTQVNCRKSMGANGMSWTYSTIPAAGTVLNDSYFHSPEYRALIGSVSDNRYLRIFCDSSSFPWLCDLRDDLIRHRKLYNWHVCDDPQINFVEGIDGRVQ